MTQNFEIFSKKKFSLFFNISQTFIVYGATSNFCFRVACVITGGNIDNVTLIRAVEQGLGAEGRLVKFRVTILDRPGSTGEICSQLASIGASIRDCIPQHCWMNGDIFSVEVCMNLRIMTYLICLYIIIFYCHAMYIKPYLD